MTEATVVVKPLEGYINFIDYTNKDLNVNRIIATNLLHDDDTSLFDDGLEVFGSYNPISNSFMKSYLNKRSFFNEFNYNLDKYQRENDIDDCLDYIFQTFDIKLFQNEFSLCDGILEFLNIEEYNTEILLGILTITLVWKEKLALRTSFYEKVKSFLNKKYHKKELLELLIGLD